MRVLSPLCLCLVVFLRCSPVFQLAKTTPGDNAHPIVFLSHWLVVFAHRCQDLLASPQAPFLVSSITLLWTHHIIRVISWARLHYPSVGVRPQTYQDHLAMLSADSMCHLDFCHSHLIDVATSRPLLFAVFIGCVSCVSSIGCLCQMTGLWVVQTSHLPLHHPNCVSSSNLVVFSIAWLFFIIITSFDDPGW